MKEVILSIIFLPKNRRSQIQEEIWLKTIILNKKCSKDPDICNNFYDAITGQEGSVFSRRNFKRWTEKVNVSLSGGIGKGISISADFETKLSDLMKSSYEIVTDNPLNLQRNLRSFYNIDNVKVNWDISARIAIFHTVCQFDYSCPLKDTLFENAVKKDIEAALDLLKDGLSKDDYYESFEKYFQDYPDTKLYYQLKEYQLKEAKTNEERHQILTEGIESIKEEISNQVGLQNQILEELSQQEERQDEREYEKSKETDPFFNNKHPEILAMENKIETVKDNIKYADGQIKALELKSQTQSLTGEEQDKIQTLKKEKVEFERSKKEYETKKELKQMDIDYQGRMANAQIGVDAFILLGKVGHYLDLPPEFQQLTNTGVKAFKAYQGLDTLGHGLARLAVSGLDPTGISLAIAGATVLVDIIGSFFGPPPPTIEQVILDGINRVLENQELIIKNLAKMDRKLDHITYKLDEVLNELKEIKNVIQENHMEVMAKLSNIEDTLEDIQTDMNYGFDYIEYKVDKSDHNQVIREASGLYLPYYNFEEKRNVLNLCHIFGDCENLDESLENEIESQLSEMSVYFTQLQDSDQWMSNYRPVFFLEKRSDIQRNIENYLAKPPEFRVPVLSEMRDWINAHNTEDLQIIDQSLPAFRQTANAYFQDDLFVELVNVAGVWPKEQSESLELPYISEICRHSQSAGEVSKIMRENLHLAWDIYWHYSNEMRKILDQDLRPYFGQGKNYVMQVQTGSKFKRQRVFENNPELYFFSPSYNLDDICSKSADCKKGFIAKAKNFKSCTGDVYTLERGVINVKNNEIVSRSNNCQPKENYNQQALLRVPVNKTSLGLTYVTYVTYGKIYYPFYYIPQDTEMESYLKTAYRESVSDLRKDRLQSLDQWIREENKPWRDLNDFITWYKNQREETENKLLQSLVTNESGNLDLDFNENLSPAQIENLKTDWFEKDQTNSERYIQHFRKLGLLDSFKRKNTLSYYISTEKDEIKEQEDVL